MPLPKEKAGWRLLRSTDGTADTDWVGTVAAPASSELDAMPFDNNHEGSATKLDVAVVAVDSSGDAIAPAGTIDLELVELLPRFTGDPELLVESIPVSRGVEADVSLCSVVSWSVAGMGSFTIRTSSPTSLPGTLDTLEVWYRVQRT